MLDQTFKDWFDGLGLTEAQEEAIMSLLEIMAVSIEKAWNEMPDRNEAIFEALFTEYLAYEKEQAKSSTADTDVVENVFDD